MEHSGYFRQAAILEKTQEQDLLVLFRQALKGGPDVFGGFLPNHLFSRRSCEIGEVLLGLRLVIGIMSR